MSDEKETKMVAFESLGNRIDALVSEHETNLEATLESLRGTEAGTELVENLNKLAVKKREKEKARKESRRKFQER